MAYKYYKENQKRYWSSEKGREVSKANYKRQKEKNPEKIRVYNLVKKAVQRGKIEKPTTCDCCHKEHSRIEAHHEDYNYPYLIIWLCPKCHHGLHKARKDNG